MASQIIEYRQKNSLPPIPCILIENVVGKCGYRALHLSVFGILLTYFNDRGASIKTM